MLKYEHTTILMTVGSIVVWTTKSYFTIISYKSEINKNKQTHIDCIDIEAIFFIFLKWGSCYSIFSFMCMFCRSSFGPLFFFFWPLYCLFFFDIRILITPVVSFGHCVVCSSSIYGFWLPLCYLLAIVLSVLLRQTDSDYPCGIFWPLCCLFFFDKRILITP